MKNSWRFCNHGCKVFLTDHVKQSCSSSVSNSGSIASWKCWHLICSIDIVCAHFCSERCSHSHQDRLLETILSVFSGWSHLPSTKAGEKNMQHEHIAQLLNWYAFYFQTLYIQFLFISLWTWLVEQKRIVCLLCSFIKNSFGIHRCEKNFIGKTQFNWSTCMDKSRNLYIKFLYDMHTEIRVLYHSQNCVFPQSITKTDSMKILPKITLNTLLDIP